VGGDQGWSHKGEGSSEGHLEKEDEGGRVSHRGAWRVKMGVREGHIGGEGGGRREVHRREPRRVIGPTTKSSKS
jgi:hypothetical protein